MRILWLFLLFPTVFTQPGFGTSYLRNSRLCHGWSCLNGKLGLSDSLPPRDQFTAVFKSLLPPGSWQDVVEKVLDVCYGDKPRTYSNTCPGQALLHCVVDQMAGNCPEEQLRKKDACSPVASLAGVKYLFSQSVYENLEENLLRERRPAWFVKNYFDAKCCNLPPLFDSSVLSHCGFFELVHYFTHTPKYNNVTLERETPQPPTTQSNTGGVLQIVDFNNIETNSSQVPQDPLECCDVSEFIKPEWASACDFKLSWDGQNRLVIGNDSLPVSTEQPAVTTTLRTRPRDHMLLPQSCEKETCVFQHLNITNKAGAVDTAAFLKLLDNFTDANPSWNKAKARVVTTCLTKPLTEYDADCEINKVLACTFDVLTENCPYAQKNDICKHTKQDIICEISSSKHRPKNRRSICYLPSLVHPHHLKKCGISSLSRIEHSPDYFRPKVHGWASSRYGCRDLTLSTTCLLSKMGTINKYGFMDYFTMKDKIRQFTNQGEWRALRDVIISSSISVPMYKEYCNSSKKLLNVLDTVLMTCPASKRKNTPQCAKLFSDISNTAPERNLTQEKLQQILKHFEHVFLPQSSVSQHSGWVLPKRRTKKVIETPIYNFGLLNSNNAPPVKVIDIKTATTKPPVRVIAPVYMPVPIYRKNLVFSSRPGVPRTAPLWYRGRVTPSIPYRFNGPPNPITYTSTASSISTTLTKSTKIIPTSTTQVLSMNEPQPLRFYSSAAFHTSTIAPVSTKSVRVFDDSTLDRSERMK